MEITVANLNLSYRVNKRLVAWIARETLKILKKTRGVSLGFIFLDDKAIRRINKRFKHSDRPTDVLSFSLFEYGRGPAGLLGEIYISIDRAAVQSRIYRTDLASEFVRYIIHGMLHLFGYDDMTVRERSRMSAKEDVILQCLSRKETLSKVLTRL